MNNFKILGSNGNYGSKEVFNFFNETMQSTDPLFFGRIGGSDYEAIIEYFSNKKVFDDENWFASQYFKIKRFNGYFDYAGSKENFRKYLDTMIEFYKLSDHASYCNENLVKQFDSLNFTETNTTFLPYILDGKTVIDYNFIQQITPFMQSFKSWGEGKTILIISPLSKSLEHQFSRKDNLYTNYKFPNCELKTYNTKITYSNGDDTKEDLRLTTDNWHEECILMADEISKIDFDIALLSCASYSMYLGNFIKNKLNKKAIYIGGCLNVMFNIYGGRFGAGTAWENIYKDAGLNLKYQIDPLENQDLVHIKSGRAKPSDGIAAYFGSRDGKYKFKKMKK